MKYAVIVVGCIGICLFPHDASAVLPPDIIFSVGSQFAQFFSVIALLVGGVLGSILVALRSQFIFLRMHARAILTVLIMLVCICIAVFYVVEDMQNEKKYTEYIAILNAQLASSTRTITSVTTGTPSTPIAVTPATQWGAIEDAKRIFNSDAVFLYGSSSGNPFYLELDMNRRQAPSGSFMHYYYTVGSIEDTDIHEYQQFYSSTTAIVPTQTILGIERAPFSDFSTREEIHGTVMAQDTRVTFALEDIQGDFITKNTQAYTRTQSAGEGTVTIEGVTFPVYALAEKIYSNDFSTSLFFAGADRVEASTRQFVLWDDQGNFYLLDQSEVFSNTPEYPSHTWLLYKNNEHNYTKKSFNAEVIATAPVGSPETQWTIKTPDFDQGTTTLTLTKYIDDGDTQTRLRALVHGEITDASGTRSIGGFAHIIKTTP